MACSNHPPHCCGFDVCVPRQCHNDPAHDTSDNQVWIHLIKQNTDSLLVIFLRIGRWKQFDLHIFILFFILVMLRLCEVMELEPIPVLLLMIIYSNIGGTATAIGDPPNVLIVSDENIKEAVSFIETFCPPKQPMQSLNSQFWSKLKIKSIKMYIFKINDYLFDFRLSFCLAIYLSLFGIFFRGSVRHCHTSRGTKITLSSILMLFRELFSAISHSIWRLVSSSFCSSFTRSCDIICSGSWKPSRHQSRHVTKVSSKFAVGANW